MRKVRLVVAGTAVLTTLVMIAGSANAVAPFPKKALTLSTWMARAYDPCSPGVLSVVGAGVPSAGCLAANAVTDDTLTMNFAKVRVTRTGRVKLFATGLTFGDVVRVRLKTRITKKAVVTKHPPLANQTVTFADQTVDCPPAPTAFTVRPNGSIAASTDLAACFGAYPGLAGTLSSTSPNNIEILGVSLVNVVNGKELARSGVVR